MSLRHEFLLCDLPEDPDFWTIEQFYINNREKSVYVRDKTMTKYIHIFSNIKTYWGNHGFSVDNNHKDSGVRKQTNTGLNYYGLSYIPYTEIPSFLNCISNPFQKAQLYKVIKLCEEALKNHMGILYCGI